MKINVEVNGLTETMARLRGLADRKIKTAMAAALNDAAQVGAKAVREEMTKVFDRPTPWMLKSVVYFKAGLAGTKVRVPGAFDIRGAGLNHLLAADRLEAVIDLSGDGNKSGVTPSMVLNAEIQGGQRRLKRHEVALQRLMVLPNGYSIVPGEAAKMDAFGNMSAGQIRQILSFFDAAHMVAGPSGNMTTKTRAKLAKGNKRTGAAGFEYFVVQPGQRRTFQRANGKTGTHAMQPGIYQRIFLGHGTAIRPVMIFVRSTNYRRRLDFYGIADRVARAQFAASFDRYIAQMLKERGL